MKRIVILLFVLIAISGNGQTITRLSNYQPVVNFVKSTGKLYKGNSTNDKDLLCVIKPDRDLNNWEVYKDDKKILYTDMLGKRVIKVIDGQNYIAYAIQSSGDIYSESSRSVVYNFDNNAYCTLCKGDKTVLYNRRLQWAGGCYSYVKAIYIFLIDNMPELL